MTSSAQSPLWLPSTLKGKARVSVVACQALAYLPKPLSPVVSVAPPHWPTCCSWLCQALQPQDLSLLPRSGSGVFAIRSLPNLYLLIFPVLSIC